MFQRGDEGEASLERLALAAAAIGKLALPRPETKSRREGQVEQDLAKSIVAGWVDYCR